jgi:hypothetical protein
MFPVRAFEAASKRMEGTPAVQSFGPGDEEPSWAGGITVEGDER